MIVRMASVLRQLSLLLMLVVTLTSSRTHHHHRSSHSGVMIRSESRLGETEIRARYGRFLALESVIPGVGEEGLYYRKVTDGRFYIQAIYKGRENMVDCDLTKADEGDGQSEFVSNFEEKEKELRQQHHMSNVTITHLDSSSRRDDLLQHLLDMPTLKKVCRRLHRQLKHELRAKSKFNRHKENAADAFNHLIGQDVPLSNSKKDSKKTSHQGSSRAKRFIYPGTNWCGNGNAALDYDDLGDNVATDKCCRGHDHCPYTIEGFQTKYRYFNFRFHTLSHCHCDEM